MVTGFREKQEYYCVRYVLRYFQLLHNNRNKKFWEELIAYFP
jgi:hypothetical protein